MKKTILILVLFLLGIVAVLAQESHDSEIGEGKKLVESKTGCDRLSSEQLEAIGDYYMEQMHPGESHELMDTMMGGEGSASLKQVHITMAKRLYCNEDTGGVMGGSMMQMMMGNTMMGGGMMGNYPASYDHSYYGYWNIFWILLFAAGIFLLVWIIHRLGTRNIASETPLTILGKRFAKGEISTKEFAGMKKELEE